MDQQCYDVLQRDTWYLIILSRLDLLKPYISNKGILELDDKPEPRDYFRYREKEHFSKVSDHEIKTFNKIVKMFEIKDGILFFNHPALQVNVGDEMRPLMNILRFQVELETKNDLEINQIHDLVSRKYDIHLIDQIKHAMMIKYLFKKLNK